MNETRHPGLLRRETSALVVVDMQESLLAIMHGRDALVANVALLCKTARLLHIPILSTTQYAARLGPLAPAIADAIGVADVTADKLCFSCWQSPLFADALRQTQRTQVVVCGVETHICVSQTAHDVLHAGFAVHVAADAVSSRTLERHKLGMERIRDANIKPCAAEATVYEWLGAAGTPEFKAVLPWVR